MAVHTAIEEAVKRLPSVETSDYKKIQEWLQHVLGKSLDYRHQCAFSYIKVKCWVRPTVRPETCRFNMRFWKLSRTLDLSMSLGHDMRCNCDWDDWTHWLMLSLGCTPASRRHGSFGHFVNFVHMHI